MYDLGLPLIGDLTKDNTDRNRTSPFAFTGNKFEFRAVGSSANPAFPMTVLNAVVAESLNLMMDEIEATMKSKNPVHREKFSASAMPVIQKYLKISRPIRYSGDNYSEDWKKEASKRSLPNISKSYEAFEALTSKTTIEVFKGILNKHELISLYEISLEAYVNTLNIEAKVMLDLFSNQLLPAACKYQREMAENLASIEKVLGKSGKQAEQIKRFKALSLLIEKSMKIASELEEKRLKSCDLPAIKKAKAFGDQVVNQCEQLRTILDQIEMIVDDTLWPLPKYREILFLV